MIFLPMAISFVGAAVTWQLIYSFRPEGFGTQHRAPQRHHAGARSANPWPGSELQPWNNLFLMVIMVWMQTGFAMVVLSAAIKSIPDEIVEAARIDGASEWQVFRRILVPSILADDRRRDDVHGHQLAEDLRHRLRESGNAENDGTEVIAEQMIRWFFLLNNNGRAAAIAVVLFIAIIPVMVWNIRRFREEEAIR